jgi:hypothetical protein
MGAINVLRENPTSPLRLSHLERGEPVWFRGGGSHVPTSVRADTQLVADAMVDIMRYTVLLVRDEVADGMGVRVPSAAPNRSDAHPAIVATIGSRTFGGLLKAAKDWHRDLIRLDDAKLHFCGANEEAWHPLSTDCIIDGMELRFLHTAAQLRQEGEAMKHCVGSYASRCAAGRSHIVSIRNSDGVRVSTADLAVESNASLKLVVSQHYGPENAPPDTAAELALKSWLARVMNDEVRIMPEAVQTARVFDEMGIEVGIPGNRFPGIDAVEGIFDAYQRHLPKEDRKMSRESWIAKYGLREVFEIELAGQAGGQAAGIGQNVQNDNEGPAMNFGFEGA